MEIKNYISKIITSDDNNKKEELINFVSYILEHTDGVDKEEAEKKLYEMSEGKVLNEERAGKIIETMKPFGEKWTLEDTEGVRKQYGYEDIQPVDFWIVMNSAYNDYEDLFKDNIEYYAKFSRDFIKDEDAVDEKVYIYFTKIPKKSA